MKLSVILMLTFLISCASNTKEYDTRPFSVTDKTFNPYIENWKIQTPNFKSLHPDMITGNEIVINFDKNITMNYPSMCKVSPNLQRRYISVNPSYWEKYPNKREKMIISLLNMCYSLKFSQVDHAIQVFHP